MTKWNRFAGYLFGLIMGIAIGFASAAASGGYARDEWLNAFWAFAAAVGLGFYLNRDVSPQKQREHP